MSFTDISPFNTYQGDEVPDKFFGNGNAVSLHGNEVEVYDNTLTTYQRYSTAVSDIKDSEDNIWDNGFVVEYKIFISEDGAPHWCAFCSLVSV